MEKIKILFVIVPDCHVGLSSALLIMPKSKGRTSTEGRSGRYHLDPSTSSRPSFHHGSLSSADSGSLSHFNASFSHPSSPLLTSNQVIILSVLCLIHIKFIPVRIVLFDYPECGQMRQFWSSCRSRRGCLGLTANNNISFCLNRGVDVDPIVQWAQGLHITTPLSTSMGSSACKSLATWITTSQSTMNLSNMISNDR